MQTRLPTGAAQFIGEPGVLHSLLKALPSLPP
jgi:hypothetical protein